MRANNELVCQAAEDEPAEGGNLAKFKEQAGDGREPLGVEYSFFGYKGSNAEEFVSILLVRDFEKNKDLEGLKSPLLDPKFAFIGISNDAHTKTVNSIQIILLESLVNNMM